MAVYFTSDIMCLGGRSKACAMKFDIYGRFQLRVLRQGNVWMVYRLEPGKNLPVPDVVIPPELEANEIGTFLDDLFHEMDLRNLGVKQIP
jgi:hypothetical protein